MWSSNPAARPTAAGRAALRDERAAPATNLTGRRRRTLTAAGRSSSACSGRDWTLSGRGYVRGERATSSRRLAACAFVAREPNHRSSPSPDLRPLKSRARGGVKCRELMRTQKRDTQRNYCFFLINQPVWILKLAKRYMC